MNSYVTVSPSNVTSPAGGTAGTYVTVAPSISVVPSISVAPTGYVSVERGSREAGSYVSTDFGMPPSPGIDAVSRASVAVAA